MRQWIRMLVASAVAISMAVVLSGCAALGPDRIPSVRPGVGATYRVDMEFTSVNNLPSGADVMMNGRRIGEVRSLRLSPSRNSVVVEVGLRKDLHIPRTVSAIIRQNTVLGDTYIALVPPTVDNSGAVLRDGDTVPLDRTSSPPPLEDMIAVLAYFVNGGSIQKIQDTMSRLNNIMPDLRAVRSMSTTVATDLSDVSTRLDVLDHTINTLNGFAQTLDEHGRQLATLFSPATSNYWLRLWRDIVAHIGTILPSIGSVFEGGLWLIPMLESVARLTVSGRVGWDAAPETLGSIKQLLNTQVVPFTKNPRVDIQVIRDQDGRNITGDVRNVFRMLGVVS